MLFEAGHTPYNAAANIVNCRGMGTCGTCAVEVQVVAGPGLSQQNWKEKARLSCPPHVRVKAKERLRLACQCRVLPGTTVTVSKHPGMWGHKLLHKRGSSRMACAEDSGNTDAGSAGSAGFVDSAGTAAAAATSFDALRAGPIETVLAALDEAGGWDNVPPWLKDEMRSNQAGETGAVSIYIGALWALNLRMKFGAPPGGGSTDEDVGIGTTDAATSRATAPAPAPASTTPPTKDLQQWALMQSLLDFAEHHREIEREHLVLINEILPPVERSRLLPVWRVAGFLLGAV